MAVLRKSTVCVHSRAYLKSTFNKCMSHFVENLPKRGQHNWLRQPNKDKL